MQLPMVFFEHASTFYYKEETRGDLRHIRETDAQEGLDVNARGAPQKQHFCSRHPVVDNNLIQIVKLTVVDETKRERESLVELPPDPDP